MDKKKIIIMVSILFILCCIGLNVYLVSKNDSKKEDFNMEGISVPLNEDILKDKIVGDLKIRNVSLFTRYGVSTFRAEVLNDGNSDLDIGTLKVIFYEGDKNTEVSALKDVSISSGGSVYMSIESENDFSKVSKIEYILE